MKHTFKFLQIVLLICGVCVAEADEVKTVSVMEGESVTLNTGVTESQGIDLIQWGFGESGSTIAQMNEKQISYPNPSHIDIFRGKLQLDQTGSLTIKNMRIKHSGLYKVEIDLNSGSSRMTFNVTVSESPSVVDVGKVEMKTESVMEGNSVTLQTDVTETHGDELIVWRFGDEGKLIAKHDVEAKSSPLLDTDERFRDRLQLDHQTGSLTITNTKTTDSGFYTVKINSNRQTLYKRFIVTVSAVQSSGPSSGAIVGIVVAVLAAVAAVVAVIFKRNRIPERQKQIDSMKPKTVKCPEGEYAVLRSDHDIKRGDQIRWTRVSVKESAIASISENDKKKTYWYDERFGDRLQLNPQTGSLTIRNFKKTDTGVYVLEIKSRRGTIYRKYEVSLSDELETVSFKEGDDVTLGFSEDKWSYINWMFGDYNFGETKMLIENDNKFEYPDGRFRGRVQLDKEKGSLTIKNIRTEHTGLYVVTLGLLSKPGLNFKPFRVVFDDFTETSENESVITGFLGRILRFCGQARTEGEFGDEKDEVKTLSVMEGGDLNLNTDTEIQTDDEIIVRFGTCFRKNHPYIIIARFSKPGDEFKSEEMGFKDRLHRNLTGPLTITITDFRNTDCGDYYVQITNKKKKSFKSFTFIVVPSGAVKSVSVTKGESINLVSPIGDLHEEYQVLWTFGPHDMIIDDINTRCDEKFKGRVKLDETTGSLTIRESTKADTGEYKRQIICRNRVIHQRFNVKVFDDVKRVSVTKGKSINLVSPIGDLHEEYQVLWTFGPHDMIIDDINTTRCDERFRGRVKLDKTTGSLTIRESTTEDTGEYKRQIISRNRVRNQFFYVTVFGSPKATTQDEPEPVYANDTPILQMQPDSSGNRKNESVTVVMPLLRGENKQEGMSSL